MALTVVIGIVFPAMLVFANDYTNLIWTQESGGGNYSALNTQGGSAAGAYQITAGTLESLGYIQYNSGSRRSWSSYSWTAQATSQGVSSLSGFLNTSAGHALQDQAFSTLTTRNWNSLSSAARGLVGQTVSGVAFTESGLLTAAHFLGAGALNDWVESGFDPTVLPAHYLTANGFSSYDDLQAYLMRRIGEASGTQYVFGFGGGYSVGGTYSATEGFPGFGAKRQVLIRETPPFQGERTNLGGSE